MNNIQKFNSFSINENFNSDEIKKIIHEYLLENLSIDSKKDSYTISTTIRLYLAGHVISEIDLDI